jgi:hypothetical protein
LKNFARREGRQSYMLCRGHDCLRAYVSLRGCDPTPQSFSCQARQSDFRRAEFLSLLGYNTRCEGRDRRSMTRIPSRLGT